MFIPIKQQKSFIFPVHNVCKTLCKDAGIHAKAELELQTWNDGCFPFSQWRHSWCHGGKYWERQLKSNDLRWRIPTVCKWHLTQDRQAFVDAGPLCMHFIMSRSKADIQNTGLVWCSKIRSTSSALIFRGARLLSTIEALVNYAGELGFYFGVRIVNWCIKEILDDTSLSGYPVVKTSMTRSNISGSPGCM